MAKVKYRFVNAKQILLEMVFLPHFEQNSVRLFCSKRYFFVYLQQNKRKDYGTENYRKKAGD